MDGVGELLEWGELYLVVRGTNLKYHVDGEVTMPLAAEICTGSHNRLLRRQHCSSLCSQSEGHEHVANMTNALGHDFVGFSVLVRHNIRPPSLCEQSELQCFASDLRQMSARCPLQWCRTRLLFAQNESRFFWILNTPPFKGSGNFAQCFP